MVQQAFKERKKKYQNEQIEGRTRAAEEQKITQAQQKKAKPKFIANTIQITLLALLAVGAGASMFSDKPLRAITSFGDVKQSDAGLYESVNKPALVKAEKATFTLKKI